MNGVLLYKNKILNEYKTTSNFLEAVSIASIKLSPEESRLIFKDMKKEFGSEIDKAVYSWNPEYKLKEPGNKFDEKLPMLKNEMKNTKTIKPTVIPTFSSMER